MTSENNNTVIEFILLGLSSDPSVQIILFHLFLVVYTATLAGNVLLMVAVRTDSRLHRPMYFFLTNLSFMDICYTSIIVPKMLADFLATRKSISFIGCSVQIYFYLFLGESECILLAFMAYDRFVAICNPLRYSTLMNIRVCARMITVVWMMGCIISSVDIYFIVPLAFCGPNIIDHFFCEAPSLLQLSCSDISINNILRLLGSAILLPVPLVLILFSYIQIIMSILRIHHGQYKSFSTCFSHLVVVVIFYGTAMFMYMRPRRSVTDATDKMVSLFYTIITPMLNPVIYSLRNKDVHKALRTLKQRSLFV
ncbi:olfactory receptor 10A7-like [Spea bombifrons]|uniref:olfactory receptor 10A7-like n=1 Tax=Spea bombifrons TaxID=233779 RepID=UPI00234A6201|nr:olfactory receptor 10A7-like [Spea bombifrons]